MNATKKPERTEAQRLADRAEDRTYLEGRAREQMHAAVKTILMRLEGIADDIRRVDGLYGQTPDATTAAKLAEAVQHTVLWGLANLNLDDLTRRAHEADEVALQAATARMDAELSKKQEAK